MTRVAMQSSAHKRWVQPVPQGARPGRLPGRETGPRSVRTVCMYISGVVHIGFAKVLGHIRAELFAKRCGKEPHQSYEYRFHQPTHDRPCAVPSRRSATLAVRLRRWASAKSAFRPAPDNA